MKKVIALLTVLLILPQVFVFTANAEEETTSYEDLFASPYDEWIEEHGKYRDEDLGYEFSEEIKSKDGKYGYVLNEKTGEAYFSHAFEKNLKVLNIPEEIDGHRIVGAINGRSESPYLFEVNYSKYIKDIFYRGLNFSKVPSCKINLNEGLEVIHRSAFMDLESQGTDGGEFLDELIFPKTLKEIKPYALSPNIKRIVFQSDPIVDLVSHNLFTLWGTGYGEFEDWGKREIYYTGNALNATDRSFCEIVTGFETVAHLLHPWKIYHKPGAKGFEKFEEVGHEVYEYTKEVWKNPRTKNPATKIVVDDVLLQVPLKKSFQIKAKHYPENSDAPRVWYFPEKSYYSIKIHLSFGGKITGSGSAGKSVKVTAVADCGAIDVFTITMTDKEVPKTTKPTNTSGTTKNATDSTTAQSETEKNTIAQITETAKQTINKVFNNDNPKTGATLKIILSVASLAVLAVAGVAAYLVIKKKK